MDRHPPDDRRVTSGAVAAAWAMVAGLLAATLLASALAPKTPTQVPVTQQAALHSQGCTSDEPVESDPDRSLRD